MNLFFFVQREQELELEALVSNNGDARPRHIQYLPPDTLFGESILYQNWKLARHVLTLTIHRRL